MRKLYVAAGLGLVLGAGGAMAADFGVGVSARSDDGFLYVPIDISKTFRIEPSVRYTTSELSFTEDGLEDSQDIEQWELGVGIFAKKQVTDAAHFYYGARLAYVEAESTSVQPQLFGGTIRVEGKQDGYRVGPTLGFEYLFGGHFSVGGEISYAFLDIEGDSRTRVGDFELSTTEVEQKASGTQTWLIFRYMF